MEEVRADADGAEEAIQAIDLPSERLSARKAAYTVTQKYWHSEEDLFDLIRRELFTAVVGDVIFGDSEGVCVVPQDATEETFALAVEKARGEKLVKQAIEDGMSAGEAFREFGIM